MFDANTLFVILLVTTGISVACDNGNLGMKIKTTMGSKPRMCS